MFNGLKKSIIRNRVKEAMASQNYSLMTGGVKSTISKVASYYKNGINGVCQSVLDPISKADHDTVANIVAEAYEPIQAIVKANKDLGKIIDNNADFFKALGKDIYEGWEKWESSVQKTSEELVKDSESIVDLGKEIYKDHLE